MPSGGSRDHGRPFAEIFKAYKGNFYDIDPLLFSPAQVNVTNLESGRTFHAGALDEKLLDLSFGG
jgi:methenyltetrahydromethanopterin cyclohydrolase